MSANAEAEAQEVIRDVDRMGSGGWSAPTKKNDQRGHDDQRPALVTAATRHSHANWF